MENIQDILVGYGSLESLIDKPLPPFYRKSYIKATGGYDIKVTENCEYYYYPKDIKIPETLFEHLEFALKNEGFNYLLLKAFFAYVQEKELIEYINSNKKGKYQRIVWFLYEWFNEKTLPIEDLPTINYVDLLDSKKYFTAKPIKHKRYAINDNLLGNKTFCPLVRKTKDIEEFEAKHLDKRALEVINSYDPYVIYRAINYLYSKETIGTYKIENDKATKDRLANFQRLLETLKSEPFEINKESLVHLQNTIVSKLYQDNGYRSTPVFVGIRPSGSGFIENSKVHYVAPKPQDLEAIMQGFLDATKRIISSDVPAIIKASVIAFSFVYIHPFQDGNGRIHRLLIHKVLADEDFTPQNAIFPISATMLKNRIEYEKALEKYSKNILPFVSFAFDSDGLIHIKNDTLDLYKSIDLTAQAEYLYKCIEKTIIEDFEAEIKFLNSYDKAKQDINAIIEMPDNEIDLFINFCVQNNFILSANKRKKHFKELSDEDILKLETLVKKHFI